MANVKDRMGQVIEVGDYAALLNADTDAVCEAVKVLDISKDSYGNDTVYVELSFKVKTSVEPMKFYTSPNQLILTKTMV